ncbi:unnamed protein product [Staurois parvus]|uniref:Secreted protein n=1 Tax=Staurois parvus TaxID=386267 RepID=A0ABN9BSA7_9NEOB|nr:unnamed protein product [Staurois parvus]
MCHFQVSSHCWCVSFCHRMLADYVPHIAAARPSQSAMGPCTASSRCCIGPQCSWVPVLPHPHCCCLPTHTLCHVPAFRSPHTAAGFHFVIDCLADYSLP